MTRRKEVDGGDPVDEAYRIGEEYNSGQTGRLFASRKDVQRSTGSRDGGFFGRLRIDGQVSSFLGSTAYSSAGIAKTLVKTAENSAGTEALIDAILAESGWAVDVHGSSPTTTFDDVYHAALFWRLWNESYRGMSSADRGRNWVYRGENKCFAKTTASMHRLSETDRAASVSRLERFVDTASMEWPWLNERQLFALAQHYGGEPDVRLQTWLLDVTWDPYVALFFASYGWQIPNDGAEGWESLGRVSAIDITELKQVLPDRNYLDIVRVPGVSRIRNQRALFVDAPDPSIVDDYSPWRTVFQQKPGLVFSDPGMSITEDFLLDKDPQRKIERWEDAAGPEVVIPRLEEPERRQRPAALSLVEIATANLRDQRVYRDLVSNPDRDRIIDLLCCVYAKMRNDEHISRVSIHWLHDAVSVALVELSSNVDTNIQRIVDVFIQKSRESDRKLVEDWMRWASELWSKRDRDKSGWFLSVHGVL